MLAGRKVWPAGQQPGDKARNVWQGRVDSLCQYSSSFFCQACTLRSGQGQCMLDGVASWAAASVSDLQRHHKAVLKPWPLHTVQAWQQELLWHACVQCVTFINLVWVFTECTWHVSPVQPPCTARIPFPSLAVAWCRHWAGLQRSQQRGVCGAPIRGSGGAAGRGPGTPAGPAAARERVLPAGPWHHRRAQVWCKRLWSAAAVSE